jgi:hypothetical protein
MSGEIRLACLYCDTDQCDGVAEIPPDWSDVDEVQSYAASREEVPIDDPARSPMEWYTHLGVCPECRKIYQ